MALLSVLITTYNLEKYIDETLESVMNQKTNYDFEVLVGDDGSSDNTVSIVEEWEKRYPGKMRHYIMDRDPSQKYNPIFRASMNRINLLKYAKGKYITFLDGDDFYIDKNKFQKQIDILEQNISCSMCAHNMNYYYPNSCEIVPMLGDNIKEGIIKAQEFWSDGMYIPAEACIMRNEFDIEQKFERYFDDNFIVYLSLQKGNCYYISDVMANYRQNENGFLTTDKLKMSIINMLDCDLEIQYNNKWRAEALKRHKWDYLNLYMHRKEELRDKFQELHRQAIEDNAEFVLTFFEHTSINKKDLIFVFRAVWGLRLKRISNKIFRMVVRKSGNE